MKYFLAFVGVLLVAVLVAAGGGLYGFYYFGRGLPDYRQLATYEPPVMTRVHAGDGRLLAEYAVERRVFVPVEAIPKRVIQAFLSAEDKTFYQHPGVDLPGIIKAAITNLANMGANRRPVGASTITQQVAKNFLLTNEVSIERKAKEAILAFRIEQALSKDRILELYLNEIYLGFGSYGVAAAALNYFNKSLDELTVSEAAYLGALPKAPNNYHPIRAPEAARARRDWVIGRMIEDGFLSAEEARQAFSEPLVVRPREDAQFVEASYFAEEVRRELADRYGEQSLYKGGLSVRTTVQPELQAIADRALRSGLEQYDRRHGWRGPVARLGDVRGDWAARLAGVEPPKGVGDWRMAAVIGLAETEATIGFVDRSQGRIPFAEMKWARPWLKEQHVGASPRIPADVLAPGDVVLVEALPQAQASVGAVVAGLPPYALRQIPDVEGALVALDPHTGRVLAMSGGYSFALSQYNRATQARRQPGSAFKPFVYLAGLEEGYTPSTLILDAPFVIDQGPGLPKWRPANYTHEFYGPSTMRLGIEKSRNLMTVRLAQTVGMEKVAEVAERFGIVDDLPETLSMSLGAGETTLLRLTSAYAMLVNGGRKITPTLIDRIQDHKGKTVFRHDNRACEECRAESWAGQPTPDIPDTRPQVEDPAIAYQMVSMLHGVVERGTGVRVKAVGKPLAGKTGTTNDSNDAWFVGFTPDLAVGLYVGFDEPRTLGKNEQGASVAAPVFRDFMQAALEGKPAIPFRIPPGVRLVRVKAETGELAQPGERNVIIEAFRPGYEPTVGGPVLGGFSAEGVEEGPSLGTGGLY